MQRRKARTKKHQRIARQTRLPTAPLVRITTPHTPATTPTIARRPTRWRSKAHAISMITTGSVAPITDAFAAPVSARLGTPTA